MKATVDANVFFSALLKKGETRRIWFNPEIELYAPAFILAEFRKYSGYLMKKSSLAEEDFFALAEKLFLQVSFVDDKELKPFLPAAASLSEDLKDWLYLACALKEDTIIWSEDKEFKKQNRVRVLTIQEMLKEFGGLK
ncbi:MAG: PIN domain-containing protein [Candidatus ainarchaeum sp.]|nr:PIN domain-containing protein [Candidatus ainarchaeum sp.]